MKLHFFEFHVTALAPSVTWYQHFGFISVLQDHQNGFELLQLHDRQIALKVGVPHPGYGMLYLQADSLHFEYLRLQQLGIEPTQSIKKSEEGYERLIYRDPDGYSLGIYAMHERSSTPETV